MDTADNYLLNFSIVPPESGPLQPTVIIAILDVSGSMNVEASMTNNVKIDEKNNEAP